MYKIYFGWIDGSKRRMKKKSKNRRMKKKVRYPFVCFVAAFEKMGKKVSFSSDPTEKRGLPPK